MSASALGVGRLRIWERYAFGLTLSAEGGRGHWGADGDWTAWDGAYSEQAFGAELWGIAGFGRRASAWVRLPTLLNRRTSGDLEELGGGFGDINVGGRYEVLSIGEIRELPAIALSVGLVMPTGRGTDGARHMLASDVTGRGVWALSGGLSLEYTRLPVFGRLDFSATVPMPTGVRGDGPTQRLATQVETALAGGVEVVRGAVLSLRLAYLWLGPVHVGGERLPRSNGHETSLTLGGSLELSPHWTLQASFMTNLFGEHMSDNRTGRMVGSLGVRYGVF